MKFSWAPVDKKKKGKALFFIFILFERWRVQTYVTGEDLQVMILKHTFESVNLVLHIDV